MASDSAVIQNAEVRTASFTVRPTSAPCGLAAAPLEPPSRPAFPSGCNPMSSGLFCTSSRIGGISNSQVRTPSHSQAARQPICSVSDCASGGCTAMLAEKPSAMRLSANPRSASNH